METAVSGSPSWPAFSHYILRYISAIQILLGAHLSLSARWISFSIPISCLHNMTFAVPPTDGVYRIRLLDGGSNSGKIYWEYMPDDSNSGIELKSLNSSSLLQQASLIFPPNWQIAHKIFSFISKERQAEGSKSRINPPILHWECSKPQTPIGAMDIFSAQVQALSGSSSRLL